MYKKDKIDIALKYSRAILNSVGLKSWDIGTDNSYSVIAKTQHDNKRIVYSKRYITIATEEEFKRTTTHEATHALLGCDKGRVKGHGQEFISLCNRLSPSMPYDSYCTQSPIHKYKIFCPGCNSSTTSNTKTDDWCSRCAAKGTGAYKLEVSTNKLDVKEWASRH